MTEMAPHGQANQEHKRGRRREHAPQLPPPIKQRHRHGHYLPEVSFPAADQERVLKLVETVKS